MAVGVCGDGVKAEVEGAVRLSVTSCRTMCETDAKDQGKGDRWRRSGDAVVLSQSVSSRLGLRSMRLGVLRYRLSCIAQIKRCRSLVVAR